MQGKKLRQEEKVSEMEDPIKPKRSRLSRYAKRPKPVQKKTKNREIETEKGRTIKNLPVDKSRKLMSGYKGNLRNFMYVLNYYPYAAYLYPRTGRIRMYSYLNRQSLLFRRNPFGNIILESIRGRLERMQRLFRMKKIIRWRKRGADVNRIAEKLKCSVSDVQEYLGKKRKKKKRKNRITLEDIQKK